MMDDAQKAVKEAKESGQKELADYPTVKKIAIDAELKDKNGEMTRVFVVDRDTKGWRRIHIMKGFPINFNALNKEMATDNALLYEYLSLMSNIDLDNDDNLAAIGQVGIEEARTFLIGFFLLSWASSLSIESVTAS